MIDTENVTCDTCTAPSDFVFDASDEVSRGWPRVDIELNPFKGDFPLLAQHPELAFLDSGATAQRPACVLEAQKSFYETMNANPLRGPVLALRRGDRGHREGPLPNRRAHRRPWTSAVAPAPTRSSSAATRAKP